MTKTKLRLRKAVDRGRVAQILLYHGGFGGSDDALGRVRELRDVRDADRVLARYTRRGLSATMRIEYPQPVEQWGQQYGVGLRI